MPTLPLLAHDSPDSIVAWRADGAVTAGQFLAEVSQLVTLFPAGKHVLNLCRDRYRFSVGLAAAIVAERISLLPPAQTPEAVRQIRDFAPDAFCLTDGEVRTADLPQLRYPLMQRGRATAFAMPRIDRQQCVAVLFTSGSTGTPQPHRKHWGKLIDCVLAGATRLGLPHNAAATIIGTVPPQHMYGFESTVLLAWQTRNALSHTQPFYPADIGRALAEVPAPRVLVSSPVHLRALLDARVELPEIARVLSATAPLSLKLARDIEAVFRAPLMEIYGSTETGQMGSRHPAHDTQWQLFPGVKLIVDEGGVHACGGHIETTVTLNDIIEPIAQDHFLLHGRLADLVNIAGKRHSLAGLNRVLNAIPGVLDGAFFMPDVSDLDHVTRLAACVVAPGIDAPAVLAALREQIDPVFLPRPLLFVDALPRNDTGKLPRAALQALFRKHDAVKSAHD